MHVIMGCLGKRAGLEAQPEDTAADVLNLRRTLYHSSSRRREIHAVVQCSRTPKPLCKTTTQQKHTLSLFLHVLRDLLNGSPNCSVIAVLPVHKTRTKSSGKETKVQCSHCLVSFADSSSKTIIRHCLGFDLWRTSAVSSWSAAS